MLKPGGQLMFNTFEKTFMDEVYDEFDNGKWGKYDNRKAMSPFYFYENPFAEYKALIKNLDFVDCHYNTGTFTVRFTQKAFDGK